jgi:hypothetical protein
MHYNKGAMSIIRKLERRLETIFEGAFARALASSIEPLEIAHHLERIIEDNRVEGLKRTYIPNVYTIRVSKKDFNLLKPFLEDLTHELAAFVRDKAVELNATLPGPVELTFEESDRVKTGSVLIIPHVRKRDMEAAAEEEASLEKTQAITPAQAASLGLHVVIATLEDLETGKKYPISRLPARIGRLESNDVRLADSAVSRIHAEIVREGTSFILRDLESTNGTKVNGRRIKHKKLAPGDLITIGQTRLRWQVNE